MSTECEHMNIVNSKLKNYTVAKLQIQRHSKFFLFITQAYNVGVI